METTTVAATLRAEMKAELIERILPFWMERTVDDVHGGFVGRINHENEIVPRAEKGLVLNARILWTFSAAYRVLGDERYRALAERAYGYLARAFRDPEHGGYYWMLTHDGRPADPRKHIYAQAFALYGISEYALATSSAAARDEVIALFELIEHHAHDGDHGGYLEAFDRSWSPLEDARLSDKDARESKSMNTHLHLLEAYTNLYRLRPDEELLGRLRGLVELFVGRTFRGDTGHFVLFFDSAWHPKSTAISYGHDIEASWLLLDAADVIGDADLRARVRDRAVEIARLTLEEGQDDDGGLFNEGGPDGIVDTDKDWWPQAEAIVGYLRAYRETGDVAFVEAAEAAWEFIKRFVRDVENGEWFCRVSRAGVPYESEDKVGPWKCPYHSGRACLTCGTW